MRGARILTAARAPAATAALALAACGPAAQPTPKVLLIGIDGVRPDVLAEVPTPNIDELAASGWYTAEARTTNPSVSGPSWSSMLTGVWPEKHGVTSNGFLGRDYDTWPSGSPEDEIPAGNLITTYGTARSAFPAVVLDLAGTSPKAGETDLDGGIPAPCAASSPKVLDATLRPSPRWPPLSPGTHCSLPLVFRPPRPSRVTLRWAAPPLTEADPGGAAPRTRAARPARHPGRLRRVPGVLGLSF